MEFDPEAVLRNARKSSTEDLLDRVTVYRSGMEPGAIEIIEAELRRRGVSQAEQAAHAEDRAEAIVRPDGMAVRCSFCQRPAVRSGFGWHRLWARTEGVRTHLFRSLLGLGCLGILLYAFAVEEIRLGTFLALAAVALWAIVGSPVFPRTFHYCDEHDPERQLPTDDETTGNG